MTNMIPRNTTLPRNGRMGLEDLTDAEHARLHAEFQRVRSAPSQSLAGGDVLREPIA